MRADVDASEKLARALIKYRMEHGISQRELARRAGVSHSTIARLERVGHDCTAETRRRLEGVLTPADRSSST